MKFSVGKNVLLPADDKAMTGLAKYKIGDVVTIEIANPRSQAFEAFIHVVIKKLADAIGKPPKSVKARLLIETGRCDFIKYDDGPPAKWAVSLWSTKRTEMTQADLRDWWNDARGYIHDKILEKLPNDTATEIASMLNDPQEAPPP